MMRWLVGSARRRWIGGQVKAPAIAEVVEVMERTATATVPMCSSVRAKRTAVLETVAMPSERRNQAMRKRTTWRSLKATLRVWKMEDQAKRRYARAERARLVCWAKALEIGGPGRGRSQSAVGTVKASHHAPTKKRTMRSGRVAEVDGKDTLDRAKRRAMLRHWTKTAAMYPMPAPLEEIFAESCSSQDAFVGCDSVTSYAAEPVSWAVDDIVSRAMSEER